MRNTTDFFHYIGSIYVKSSGLIEKEIHDYLLKLKEHFDTKDIDNNGRKKSKLVFKTARAAAMTFIGCFHVIHKPPQDVAEFDQLTKGGWEFFKKKVLDKWSGVDPSSSGHANMKSKWDSSVLSDPNLMWANFLKVKHSSGVSFMLNVALLVEWARDYNSEQINKESMMKFQVLRNHIHHKRNEIDLSNIRLLFEVSIHNPVFCHEVGLDFTHVSSESIVRHWNKYFKALEGIDDMRNFLSHDLYIEVNNFFKVLRLDLTKQYNIVNFGVATSSKNPNVDWRTRRKNLRDVDSKNFNLSMIHSAIDVTQNHFLVTFMRLVSSKFHGLPNKRLMQYKAWKFFKGYFSQWKIISFTDPPRKSLGSQSPIPLKQRHWKSIHKPDEVFVLLAREKSRESMASYPGFCAHNLFQKWERGADPLSGEMEI